MTDVTAAAVPETPPSPPGDSPWRVHVARVLNLLGVIAALVLIVSISLEAFSGQVFLEGSIYARVQLWVCVYFLLDIFLLMALAPKKMRFFFRHFLLILLSVPYLSLIDFFALSFSNEAQYLLKFLPIMRGGAALIVLVKMVVSNKLTGLFIAYLVSFFSVVYFFTLVFFVFEGGINPLVSSYYDALWWASMTVTTVGSNIVPVTVLGKVATAVLATVGMTVFPIFTVYITSLVQRMNQSRIEQEGQAQ
ncbi:potassium channel family protein [Comamonas kerstersii]|uniref:potassium channel family protein n=1 Tax=Comamonas kerstersii TaxID=225992 RepID=UPI00266CF1F0|nr:potassium channel family protein [Comamonas kerstersii]